jgi:hypothetical protein
MNKRWSEVLNFVDLGRKPDINAQSLGMATLLREVFRNQTIGIEATLHETSNSGNIADLEVFSKVREYLEQKGGKLIYQLHHEKFGSHLFLWDDSIVELEFSGENYMSFSVNSLQKDFVEDLRKFIDPLFVTEISQGHVFAIVSHGGNLALNNIGNAGIALERRNYNTKVLEDYDYVVKDLNSTSPSGRMAIMEGEPGTGKTHLVRAMLMEVPDAMFVLVSPDMVSQMGGPQLLPLLLSQRRSQEGPIILVLEDADKCLVTRQGDNINSIQSLLNLGDGILGSLLDLRILATTNAKKLEMEPALMRPGRLSRRLEVNALELDTAKDVFNNLCPGIEFSKSLSGSKKITLADVYATARKAGWSPENRKIEDKYSKENDPRSTSYDEYDDNE